MAQTTFRAKERTALSADKAAEVAQTKDDLNAHFTIPAETGETLTLTGSFAEQAWERIGKNNEIESTGSYLVAIATKADGTALDVPFGYFRTKVKRAAGGETATFVAVLSKTSTNRAVVEFCAKGKKVVVSRGYYFREGWSSESEVTTLTTPTE